MRVDLATLWTRIESEQVGLVALVGVREVRLWIEIRSIRSVSERPPQSVQSRRLHTCRTRHSCGTPFQVRGSSFQVRGSSLKARTTATCSRRLSVMRQRRAQFDRGREVLRRPRLAPRSGVAGAVAGLFLALREPNEESHHAGGGSRGREHLCERSRLGRLRRPRSSRAEGRTSSCSRRVRRPNCHTLAGAERRFRLLGCRPPWHHKSRHGVRFVLSAAPHWAAWRVAPVSP